MHSRPPPTVGQPLICDDATERLLVVTVINTRKHPKRPIRIDC